MTLTINLRGVKLTVHGTHYEGFKQTYFEPGEPETFTLDSVCTVHGDEIGAIMDDHFDGIESLCIDQIHDMGQGAQDEYRELVRQERKLAR